MDSFFLSLHFLSLSLIRLHISSSFSLLLTYSFIYNLLIQQHFFPFHFFLNPPILLIMDDLRYHPTTVCSVSPTGTYSQYLFPEPCPFPIVHPHQPISWITIPLPYLSLSSFVIKQAMIHLSGQKTNRNFITHGLKYLLSKFVCFCFFPFKFIFLYFTKCSSFLYFFFFTFFFPIFLILISQFSSFFSFV